MLICATLGFAGCSSQSDGKSNSQLTIDKSIEAKRKDLEKLLAIYGKCAEFESPVWARGAPFRIGDSATRVEELSPQSAGPLRGIR